VSQAHSLAHSLGEEYDREIIDNLQREERSHMAQCDYMEAKQKDLTPKMRAILVDWLVEVHLKFKLSPETLFIATNFVDRFLCIRENLPRAKLQLVGVTCMLLAAKYEDVSPPKLRDFIYITDSAYTRAEILEMEERTLNTLGFNLAFATPHRFLQRYVKLAKLSQRQSHAAEYLLELCLPEYSMLRYPPSHMAAASLFLSNKIFEVHPSWPSYLVDASRYTAQDIKGCAKEICVVLQKPESRSLVAIKRKFSHAKFSQVAKMIVTE
jgi:cyclin B